MGGRNPRPCVCGHAHAGICFECPPRRFCHYYRPAPRIEPLRVLRNPVIIRPAWEQPR
jgi:hypothetical protein